MKALEILKSTYESINYLGLGSISKEWDEQEFIELEKAIKELEEFNNRSCDTCKYLHQEYLCIEIGYGNIKPKEIGLCYCDKWEKKND